MADLSRLRHKSNESVEQYIDRLKKVRNKCHVFLPEVELKKLVQNDLDFELSKKFEGMEFRDLLEFSAMATRYEMLIREEQQRKNNSFGTYFQDFDREIEINAAQIIGKSSMMCDTLKKIEDLINKSSNSIQKW